MEHGKHMMPGGHMMSDKEMKKMMLKRAVKGKMKKGPKNFKALADKAY